MKNIFKSLLVPAMALAVAPFLASCETDTDDNPTLREPAGNLTLTAPAGAETTYDLLNDTEKNLTVTSTAPDYGFPALILYQLQVSLTEDFATARTLGGVNQTYSSNNAKPEISFAKRELNDSIVSLYIEANGGEKPIDPVNLKAYIRVQASVNASNTAYAYSTPVALNVIAQWVETTPSLFYIVGAMNGWGTTTDHLLYPTSTTVYSYTTKWTGDGNLKFWLDTQVGNWDACYGTQTDGDNSDSGSLVNSGAGAIVVPEKEAYYTFTADIDNMTYTWTKLDNQKQVRYSSLTLTGDFLNWGEGGAGALKETTPNNWYAQITIPSDGQIKFRSGDKWWGGPYDISETNYGVADGGENMTIPAGTYDVFFNDITSQYVFITVE